MQVSTRLFFNSLPPANRLAVSTRILCLSTPSQSACLARRRLWIYLLAESPNPAVSTLAQGAESMSSSEPRGRQSAEFDRMRHQAFHKSINSLLFITENRQF